MPWLAEGVIIFSRKDALLRVSSWWHELQYRRRALPDQACHVLRWLWPMW